MNKLTILFASIFLALCLGGCWASADAAPQKNWTVDFHVIGSEPTDSHMNGGIVFNSIGFNPDIGYNVADGTVNSSWPYITCSLENRHVMVDFKAKIGAWPTSWPSTVTCSHPDPTGGAPFNLTINLQNVIYPYEHDWTPSGTAVISLYEHRNGNKDPGFFTYRLPAGNWAAPANYFLAKKTGGGNWAGVHCGVARVSSNTAYLFIDINQLANAGTGHCRLWRHGQGWQNLPLKLLRPSYP